MLTISVKRHPAKEGILCQLKQKNVHFSIGYGNSQGILKMSSKFWNNLNKNWETRVPCCKGTQAILKKYWKNSLLNLSGNHFNEILRKFLKKRWKKEKKVNFTFKECK